jgi:hypothetical protein
MWIDFKQLYMLTVLDQRLILIVFFCTFSGANLVILQKISILGWTKFDPLTI